TRAAALTALIDSGEGSSLLRNVADKDPLPAMRALAVRALAERGADAAQFLDDKQHPAVRLDAVASLTDRPRLLRLLPAKEPSPRNGAVQQLARKPDLLAGLDLTALDPLQRMGVLLALRSAAGAEAERRVPEFLADADPEVRFLAAKWIADQ